MSPPALLSLPCAPVAPMKPPPFVYHDPETLSEALALLGEWGDESKVLAGGQSLVPILNFRLARPSALIDINRIVELSGIQPLAGELRIGALTCHAEVERSPLVRQACPLLAEAVPQIGHPQIRNRGTFGGSLAHADPSAELPLVATLLDAEVRTRQGDESSSYRSADFFQGYLTTALAVDELLTEVILPPWPPGAGWAFLEVSPRQGDFALVSAAAILQIDADRRVQRLRLGLGGCGPAPARITTAESLAIGRTIDDSLLSDLIEAVRAAIEPETDIHASADYRRDVAGTLVQRAVKQAAKKAG